MHGASEFSPQSPTAATPSASWSSTTHVTQDVLEQVEEAARALAYIIVTDRRFTDRYHLGNRTATVTLAAEIQRQLLPSALLTPRE